VKPLDSRHAGLQRVIRRIVQGARNVRDTELRIGDDEIFRQSAVPQHAADLPCEAGVRVQIIRQAGHVAVGNEGSRT
jgi:hypothetical protein